MQRRDGAPGMVIVRPEGEPHSNRFDRAGGRCLNLEMPPRWLTRIREHRRAFDTPAAFRGAPFALAGRRLQEELAHPDDVSPLAVESLVLGTFADAIRELGRSGAAPPRWLSRTKEHLHAEFAVRLTLQELATEAHVHPVHLATAFRRFFGTTVAAYVRQLRIDYACRAIAQSDAPLSEIALAAGFSDQSHFGRTFKRFMHMTPAQYRANVPAP